MAKKDDELEFDFDSWQSEFDSELIDDSPINTDQDRDPAANAKTQVKDALKAAGSSTIGTLGASIGKKISSEMYNTSSFVGEAMDVASDVLRLKDDFTKEITPTINQIKRSAQVFAPKLENYMPKSWHEKLTEALKVEDDGYKPASIEAAREQNITEAIEATFAKEQALHYEEVKEDRTERFVDRALDSSRHKELTGVVDEIRLASNYQMQFSQTTLTAFMKKRLELAYKHLFVSQDILEVTKMMAKALEEKLEQVRHNTALPDVQKERLTEAYKGVAIGNMSNRFNSYIHGWGRKILGNIKDQIFDPIKGGLDQAAMGAEMAAMAADMHDDFAELGGPQTSAGSTIGGLIGSQISEFLGGKIGGKILGKLSPYARNMEDMFAYMKTKAALNVQDYADKQETGTTMDWLMNLVAPGISRGPAILSNPLQNPTAQVPFDIATRTSIVEIIPGYLAKILQQVTNLATGTANEELVYDANQRDFVGSTKFRESLMQQVFGSKKERAYNIGAAVGAARGAYAHHGHDDFQSFDAATEDISRIINNAATGRKLLEPGQIKSVAEGLDPKETTYTEMLFKGIKEPATVAKILINALYRDADTVNQQATEELNRYVIGLISKDDYLDKLPTLANGLGYARHFGDLFKRTSRGDMVMDNDKLNEQRGDVDADTYRSIASSYSRYTKSSLDQDVKDKQDLGLNEHIREIGERLSGNALRTQLNDNVIPDMTTPPDTPDVIEESADTRRTRRGVKRIAPQPKLLELPPGASTPTTLSLNLRQPLMVRMTESVPIEIKLPSTVPTLPVDIVSSQIPLDVKLTGLNLADLIPPRLPSDTPASASTSVPTTTAVVPPPSFTTGSEPVVKAINRFEQTFIDYAEQQKKVLEFLESISTNIAQLPVLLHGTVDSLMESGKGLVGKAKGLAKKGLMLPWEMSKWSYGKSKDLLLGPGVNVLKGAGSALGLAGKTAAGVAGLAADAAFGLTNWGIDGLGGLYDRITGIPDSLSDASRRTKATVRRLGRKAKKQLYVDVYRKDEVVPGSPILSQKQQVTGVIFASGGKVLTSYAITEPVLDPETQQTLITKEDIEHGLVDVENKSLTLATNLVTKTLSLGGKAFGLGGKLAKGASGLIGKAGSFVGSAAKTLLGPAGSILDLYAKGAGLAMQGVGAVGRGIGRLTGRMFGFDLAPINEKSLQKIVGDRLDDIYTLLQKRLPDRSPIAGDTDNDGDRDGSYRDQMDKKKAETTEKDATASKAAKGGVGSLGLLGAIRAKLGGKSDGDPAKEGEDEGSGGIMDYLKYKLVDKFGGKALGLAAKGGGALMTAGRAALGWLSGLGAAGAGAATVAEAGALGAGVAGTGALGATAATATTAASGAAALGGGTAAAAAGGTGMLAASLATNPVGWGIGLALVAGLAGYGIYKYFGSSDKSKSLLQLRADAYGIDLDQSTGFFSSSMSSKVNKLEERTLAIFNKKAPTMSDADLEYWTDAFGLDSSDKEQVQFWATWYRQRFAPVYRIYVDLLSRLKVTPDTVDNLSDSDLEDVRKYFVQATASHTAQINSLVPTPEGFKKFKQVLDRDKEAEKKQSRSEKDEQQEQQEKEKTDEEKQTDRETTSRSKEYRVSPAFSAAARNLDKDEHDYLKGPAPQTTSPYGAGHGMAPVLGAGAAGGGATSGSGSRLGRPAGDSSGGDIPTKEGLGGLSAFYESGKKGSDAIGYDRAGGTSYGKYQIASAVGTFRNFLSWVQTQGAEGKEVATRLQQAGPANTMSRDGAVPQEWRRLVAEGKMGDFEHEFIKATHFTPALKSLPKEIQALIKSNATLQDVLWSTAVQHGPGGADKIFSRVYKDGVQPAEYVQAIYDERARVFPPTAKRYSEEKSKALALLKDGGKPGTEVAQASTPAMTGMKSSDTTSAAPSPSTTPPSTTPSTPAVADSGSSSSVPTTSTAPVTTTVVAADVPSTSTTVPTTPTAPVTKTSLGGAPAPMRTGNVEYAVASAASPTPTVTATPAAMTNRATPAVAQVPTDTMATPLPTAGNNVAMLLSNIATQIGQLQSTLVSIFGSGQVFQDILQAIQAGGVDGSKPGPQRTMASTKPDTPPAANAVKSTTPAPDTSTPRTMKSASPPQTLAGLAGRAVEAITAPIDVYKTKRA